MQKYLYYKPIKNMYYINKMKLNLEHLSLFFISISILLKFASLNLLNVRIINSYSEIHLVIEACEDKYRPDSQTPKLPNSIFSFPPFLVNYLYLLKYIRTFD